MRWLSRGLVALRVLCAVELALLVVFRSVNLDEGWYLWASKLVYEGKLLYHDFAYTQAPVLPYVYGLFQWSLGRGLYQGRVLTALLALLTFSLSGRIARRVAGPWAEALCLLFCATSFYALAFFAYTATYALTALLIVAGIYASQTGLRTPHREALAVALVAAATGVRLSVAAALLPFALCLILASPQRRRTAVWIVGAGGLTLALIFLPFLAASRANMLYDILGFHTDRMLPSWQMGVMRNSLVETAIDFSILLGAAFGSLALFLARRGRERDSAGASGELPSFAAKRAPVEWLGITLACMVLGLLAAHLIPRTTQSYYNALALPLLSLMAGVLLARVPESLSRLRLPARAWAAAIVALLLANGVQQWSSLRNYELISDPPRSQVAVIRAAAEELRHLAPAGSPLITFDTHLALEAGMQVPPGFEMSIFSYRPTFSTEMAQRYRVVNNELLLRAWRELPGVVAMTAYDEEILYGERDRLFEELHGQYRWVKTVPGFGPFYDDLRIWLPPRFDPPAPEVQLEIPLADGIRLLGYDVEQRTYRPGETLSLALYWQAGTSAPTRNYTVFMHALDQSGALQSGWDNPPCRRTCPTTGWRPGEVLRDEYDLPLKPGLPPGEYQLEAGMYDAKTGRRLPLVTGSGQAPADRVVLGKVRVQ